MKFFRIDLLTLLISLFILNSCKNQDTVGLAAKAGDQLAGSITDTATVFTNTVLEDSVATSGLTKTPLGYFTDPVFGTSEAALATDLNLPESAAYTLPTGTIYIDSAVLVLQYAAGFYGDSVTSKYTANVYQMNTRVTGNQTYYNDSQFNYNASTVVGTKSFYATPNQSTKITDIVSGGPDTLKTVPPQIRIPMSSAFINKILFQASAEQLASNLVFKNNVKGLYINIDKSKVIGPGGTLMIKAPGDSAIQVYIRSVYGSVIDTSIVYLPVAVHAAAIKHTYTPAILSALSNTKTSDTVFYVQGLAGLRSKISFPYIKNLFSSLGGINNVIINRAELVVSVLPGSDIPAYLAPQPKLSLYRYDIAKQRTYVEDATSSSPTFQGVGEFGGYYYKKENDYHFLVTTYMQDLIRGNTVDYGTYIGAVDTTNTSTVDILATPQTAGRVVAVGNNKKSNYRVKLNVIYTIIKKQ